ncbi:SRPBCC family protein [Clostridium felsineum]|uniref:Activator of Hsp90 ATPase homologue 1/2-like C-terminal domain-containing protein n=2 Tax=Clostridium felsineum TaxID=36839 RepID=A0A1S8LZV1_9CLOT|nr:SRPBCC family protein [Clostridium felsineum]URZ05052.1 hypothetical protein CLROS_003760 [Clostridium felsineum]URZ10093.1 hypothetical protein CROST_008010 [Clostridium felsineum]
MDKDNSEKITIETVVNAPVKKTWEYWTKPDHIKKWNTASDDWHTTICQNDLKVGGKFISRMEAKNGSIGFDFGGIYDEVKLHESIKYTLGDGRKVEIKFNPKGDETEILESFDAEKSNPIEHQRSGWQAILNNFKKYVEKNNIS